MIQSGRNRVQTLTAFALKKLGTSSQETLYVGDSPYDYQTAQNVSMPCILLSTGTHSSDELSKLNRNLIIKRNLSEVLPVLNLPNIDLRSNFSGLT